VDMLPAIQHNINNAHSDAIGRSPNELLYGFKPNTAINLVQAAKDIPEFEEMRKLYHEETKASLDWIKPGGHASVTCRVGFGSKPPRQESQDQHLPVEIVDTAVSTVHPPRTGKARHRDFEQL
jgi:hypothetical protein